MASNKEVIIAGDGNGIKYLYQGVVGYFDQIYVFTNTKEVIDSSDNTEFIDDFFAVETKHVICSAYAPLLSNEVLAKKEFLNIHYALLPRFRGMHPIVWGILNDEKFLGFTLHLMDEHMDSGPIIYQYKIANDFSSTATDYMFKCHENVKKNIGQVLCDYYSGKIELQHQDKKSAVWGAKRNLDDCKINFCFTNNQLKNFFRALVRPYPLPFFTFKGKRFFITSHKIIERKLDFFTLGRVVNIDDEGLWIKVKEGYLVVSALEDELGNDIKIKESFRIGSRLA